MNQEFPDVQAGFRKGRGTRDQIANICWIIKKARESQKDIYLCFINYAKAFECVDHNKLWKALKEMGISEHLTVSWKTCMQMKKQELELCMEQLTGSRLVKEYDRAVCCHPVCLIYMLSTSWEMPAWNINNLRYADDTTLMAESEQELKSLLMKVKKESERDGLKLNIKNN